MTVTVYSRTINGKKTKWEFHSTYTDGMPDGKKSDWEFDSIYVDGCEGGKRREKEYAQNFLEINKKEDRIEYKVKVTNE